MVSMVPKWSRKPLKVPNSFKLILNGQKATQTHLESMWNHPEPSYVPFFSNMVDSTNSNTTTISIKLGKIIIENTGL
jgi:hypothetical protein